MNHNCFLVWVIFLLLLSGGSAGRESARGPEPEAVIPSPKIHELPAGESIHPVEVVRTDDYSEGVVIDNAGNIYFSHQKIITIVTPDGMDRVWAETGQPNGHKILADGTHLVCDATHHAVLRLDAQGNILEPASKECDGKPLRGPNDLSLDPAGGFYFTDPGGSDDGNPLGTVHYVDSRRKTHSGGSERLAFPNGLVLTADRKRLLVAESKKNRILAYDLSAPGKVGPLKVLADLPTKEGEQIDNQPDGICLDAAGKLYVAHYGMLQVQVLDASGRLIRRYPGGNLTTSHCAFGGPNLGQLYVTGGKPGALFRLDLGVPGLDIRPKREKSSVG